MESGPRVLVVDDEPKICELLEAFLCAEGYQVESAPTGQGALVRLESGRYDLVMTDIKMPGMDGFELARRIREMDQEIPLVVITGYATVDTAVQALREGVDDYVTDRGEALDQSLKRANRDLRQRVSELRMLNETGALMSSELDLEKLLQLCAGLVAQKLKVRRTSILLKEGEHLVVKACHGRDDSELVGLHLPFGEGVAGKVASTGKPILVENVEEDTRFPEHPERGYLTRSLVCVPLLYKGEGLGVVCATDKRSGKAFTPSDMHLLSTLASQVAPAIENARLYGQLEESTLSAVRALVAGLEAKDRYLRGHADRVTGHALEIGRAMGLGPDQMLVLERASQLHDVGKLGISDVILNKPASLSRREYGMVKRHPVLGERIITPLEFLRDVAPVIRHHHERPDGKGYPDRIGAEELPPLARIIGVADAYDAMTSARPYRPPKTPEEARKEICSLRGKQFDSEVASIFCDYVIPRSLHGRRRYGKAG